MTTTPEAAIKLAEACEPIVLVAMNDSGQKPLLYACRKCGAIHSPNIYACPTERAHETAKQAARDCYSCKTHNVCSYCGAECPKGWTACEPCRTKRKLEAAIEVEDTGGPYFEFDGERFFHELSDAVDEGVEWVAPTTVSYPHLDADRILENLLDDMHEDASTDDLDATDAFVAACKVFNEAQKMASYWPDEKRKIRARAALAEKGEADGGA